MIRYQFLKVMVEQHGSLLLTEDEIRRSEIIMITLHFCYLKMLYH
jgi:hypothetical protein